MFVSETGYNLEDEGFIADQGNAASTTYQYDFDEQIIDGIIEAYRNGAIAPSSMQGTVENVQKVVNQQIYYFRGTTLNPDITISNWPLSTDVPFTLLVENANLIIN